MFQCWIRQWDGIVFERNHLARLIGLVRFRGKRIEWLQEDLKDLFLFQEILTYGSLAKFEGIFISRSDFTSYSIANAMKIDEHIEAIQNNGGPVLGVFDLWPKLKTWKKNNLDLGFQGLLPLLNAPANYDERLMHSFLELISGGQISPLAVFPKNDLAENVSDST
jgi:hypothetical protein